MHASFSIRYTDLESRERRNSASRDDIIIARDMINIKIYGHTGYLATEYFSIIIELFNQSGANFLST